MVKIVEFNNNEVELSLILLGLNNKDTVVVLTSDKNADVGFIYDEGKHNERTALIIAYLKKNPSMIEKVKKEFGLYESGE